MCSLAKFDLANPGVRQPVQPHTYARLLVFDETLTKPDFAVITCFDVVMIVFYSLGALIILNAMTHKIRRVRVGEYAQCINKLRQNVGLET